MLCAMVNIAQFREALDDCDLYETVPNCREKTWFNMRIGIEAIYIREAG